MHRLSFLKEVSPTFCQTFAAESTFSAHLNTETQSHRDPEPSHPKTPRPPRTPRVFFHRALAFAPSACRSADGSSAQRRGTQSSAQRKGTLFSSGWMVDSAEDRTMREAMPPAPLRSGRLCVFLPRHSCIHAIHAIHGFSRQVRQGPRSSLTRSRHAPIGCDGLTRMARIPRMPHGSRTPQSRRSLSPLPSSLSPLNSFI